MADHHATSGTAGDPNCEPDSGTRRRVRVLLPLPLAEAYDYRLPEGLDAVPGDCVLVPLGSREVIGVVWGPGGGDVDEARLKDVIRRFDVAPLSEVARDFIDWVARYVMSPPGAVLRMTLRVPSALEPPKPVIAHRLVPDWQPGDTRMTPARRRVLEVLADGPPRTGRELAEEAGCGGAVVKGLVALGALETVELRPTAGRRDPDWRRPGRALTADQQAAADALTEAVREGGYTVTLLDGVTGSGKTEVYFEALAAALAAGRQVLVLLPEIALSAQWLDRFAERFGVRPEEWHSDLTQLRRRQTWRAVAEGRARVVVGARSALFLPYPDLGLIVVDEEHEQAFKQEDGVTYHARDMAVVRAKLGDLPIVLVSATPSLETTVNAESGRYRRLHLPDRPGSAVTPSVAAIDLREYPPERGCFLSPSLRAALTETLAAGEQAMLFLNRRGYAPLTLCRRCGHRLECPNCTAWLVEHRLAGRLQCHHCGFQARLPRNCPSCEAEDSFVACGPGVERVAEEAAMLLPEARVAMMASDLIHGPAQAAEIVRAVADHEVDLVIGTQLVAKGHHFPLLTLVGVVDADLGLAGGDLRASERTFQLLQQVAGRAGREERPGQVLVQTHMPDHPVIAALVAGDRDGFLAREAEERRMRGLPPFGRLAAIVVSGPDPVQVDRVAGALGRSAPRTSELRVLGPAPAPLAVLRGRHRRRLLVKAGRGVALQPFLKDWLEKVAVPGSVRVQVDIDPYSFL